MDKRGQTGDLHGASGSTEFLKQSFSTISRSKSVASISNDTDPEGKTKILTMLQLKLPHRNGTDDVTVKVDDGAEGNITSIEFFQGHVSSCTWHKWLPKTRILERIQDNVRMLRWWEAGESWQHQASDSSTKPQGSFQDHSFYVVETKTPKPIIVGHPASIRLGLIKSFMQKHFKVCFSDWENDTKQHEKLLSRPSNTDRW